MRAIPESLKVKMRLLAQTKANNADPRVESIISRHVIPIQDYAMWKTFKVANFSGRVAIAVPRPDYRRMPKEIFVAGIEGGAAKVYSALFDGINAPEIWQQVLEISGAVEISMAYEGRFRPLKKRTELYTLDPHPWIFWIDAAGDLHAQHWDDATTTVTIGASTTSCTSTMGINSVQNDWGYGLIVAWTTTAGSVFYAQLIDGIWSDGIAVPQAPANATEIVVSRVEDARMVFSVKDSTGDLTTMFFRSIATSMSNFEKMEVKAAKTDADLIGVAYQFPSSDDERMELTDLSAAAMDYSILPPQMKEASNIDDGAGNFGRFVLIKFKEAIWDFAGQAGSFALEGESGPRSSGLTISRPDGHDRRMLLLEFQDFNNAPGVCTITYTPGGLSSGVTQALLQIQTFTPTGLIRTFIPTPVPIAIHSLSNYKINITFDLEIASLDFSANVPAFTVIGQEIDRSPELTTITPVTYAIDAVRRAPEMEQFIPSVDLKAGTFDAGAGNSAAGKLILKPTTEAITETFDLGAPYNFAFIGDWIESTVTPHSGIKCFKNKVIGASGRSETQASVTLSAAANITYWYRTSSEAGCDWIHFYIDGVEQATAKKAGAIPWTQITFPLAAGTHIIKWAYTKDGSVNSGEDSVYIDDINIGGATEYNLAGSAIYGPFAIETLTRDAELLVPFDLNIPAGTSVNLSFGISGGGQPVEWTPMESNVASILPAASSGKGLYLKFDLATTDTLQTPVVYLLSIQITGGGLIDTVQIILAYPNQMKYPQGEVSVDYAPARGNMTGAEITSQVPGFTNLFTPENIIPWFNPNMVENVTFAGFAITETLTKIFYTNGYFEERIEPSANVTAALTLVVNLP